MTLPRTVAEVLSDHVAFEVECIDRMYLNVYQSRNCSTRAGWSGYVQRQLGLPVASTAPLARITDRFAAAVHRFAAAVEAHRVGQLRRGAAQRRCGCMSYLAAFQAAGRTEGVLFIGRAQEKTRLFRTEKRRDPDGRSYPWIVTDHRDGQPFLLLLRATMISARSSSSSAPTSLTTPSCASTATNGRRRQAGQGRHRLQAAG